MMTYPIVVYTYPLCNNVFILKHTLLTPKKRDILSFKICPTKSVINFTLYYLCPGLLAPLAFWVQV